VLSSCSLHTLGPAEAQAPPAAQPPRAAAIAVRWGCARDHGGLHHDAIANSSAPAVSKDVGVVACGDWQRSPDGHWHRPCSAHGAPQSHQLSPGAAATPTARQQQQHAWLPSTAAAAAPPQAPLQQSSFAAARAQQQQQEQAHDATASSAEAARAAAMLRAIQGSPPAQQPTQPQQSAEQRQRLRTVRRR
jgi:hypothetical protein